MTDLEAFNALADSFDRLAERVAALEWQRDQKALKEKMDVRQT